MRSNWNEPRFSGSAARYKSVSDAVALANPKNIVEYLCHSSTEELCAFGRTHQPALSKTVPDYGETRRSLGAELDWRKLPAKCQISVAALFETARDHWSYDLFDEPPQLNFLRYSKGDFFAWHLDVGGNGVAWRKISFSIQLSPPSDYDGGDLEIFNSATTVANRSLGSVCLFPSFVPHRVTPVTRGTRFALAGWFCGPQFK